MKNILYILILILFHLQSNAKQDTLSVEINSIEVSAERESAVRKLKGLNIESLKINREINSKQIITYLQETPGLFIKDYGGLGGLKTVSLRGTSSNQTVIALNDMPLTSSSSPSFDLNQIPIFFLNSIDIIKTGLSSYYGSNCIGGTINFKTSNYEESEKLSLNANYGSFGRFDFNLKTNFFHNNLPLSFFINYSKFDGNYPFKFNNFGNIIDTFRTNSKLNKLQTGITFHHQFSNSEFSFISFANYSDKGIPGAVLLGKIEDLKTISQDFSVYFLPKLTFLIDSSKVLSINNLISIQKININNLSNIFINNKTDYQFNSNHIKTILNYSHLYNSGELFIQPEIDFVDLTGTFLQPNLGNYVHQYSLSLTSGISKKINFLNYLWQNSLSFRFDNFSNFKDKPFSFFLGSELLLKKYETSIFLNLSKNFRIPSFSELYYFNYGNVDLKPEKSNSLNLGFSTKAINNTIFKLSSYYILSFDQIVSVPKSTLIWSAQNIDKTQNYGLELSLKSIFWNKLLTTNFSYTLQSSKNITENSPNYNKNIIYIPEEIISLNNELNFSNLYFDLSFIYNSFRYYLPDNSYNSILPSYFIVDFSFKYKLQIYSNLFNFEFAINNLTSTNYQIIRNYPMPGRNYLFSINYIIL